jgi:translocator protein
MRARRWTTYLATSVAVTATAVAGGVAVDADSDWYRELAKPGWQPPSAAFGPVWSLLYASIAWSGGRALCRMSESERQTYVLALATNLILNAGWNWLFFNRRSPLAGLVGIAALDVSNLALIRRTVRIDRPAAAVLVPYALWTGFASVLNADILRRNRRS